MCRLQIEGMLVQPGDILHGDENCLISIPKCEGSALEAAVESVRAREKKLMDYVREEDFTLEGLRGRFLE